MFANSDTVERRLRIAMLVLGVIGLGVAGYLTYVHYSGAPPLCTSSHGGTSSCLKVQTSVYSKVAGVPVALLGLIGYVAIVGLLIAPVSEMTRLGLLSVTLGGFAFSMYLTFREAVSLHGTYCEWCLSSAAIMTFLFGLSVARYLRGDAPAAAPAPAPPPAPAVAERTQKRARVAAP